MHAKLENEIRRMKAHGVFIGVKLLYVAAALNGATEPPQVTDEQALTAAIAYMASILEADLVVMYDPQEAERVRALLALAKALRDGAERRGEDQPVGDPVPAGATIN